MALSKIAIFDAGANGGVGQALTAASATPFQVEQDADFTIGCYFRPSQTGPLSSNVQPLMGQWQHLINGWQLAISPSGSPHLQVVFADGGTLSAYNCTGSGLVSIDADYLVIAEYDHAAGTASVWVNDVLDGSGAVGVPFNPTDNFYLGGDGVTGARQTGANLGIAFKYAGKLSSTLRTWIYNGGNFRGGAEILAHTGLTTPDFLFSFDNSSNLGLDTGPNALQLAPKSTTGPTQGPFAPPSARPTAGTIAAGAVTGRTAVVSLATNSGGTGVYSNRAQVSPHGANTFSPAGAPVSGATATLTAVGLAPSTSYDIRVLVTDANSGTAVSNVVTVTTDATAGAPAGITWGMNLGAAPLGYDGSSLIFGDLFLATASGWQGYSRPLRADGYPVSVDFAGDGNYAWCTIALNGHLPAGTYTLEVDGTGHYDILGNGIDGSGTWHGHDVPGGTDNTFTHVLSAATDGTAPLQLRITQSSAGDPIRKIRLWLPGHVHTTFYAPFVDSIRPFKTLRFMDWLATNGSTWVEWSDRSSTMYGFNQRGYIDVKYVWELCNLVEADCWLNLPGLMSDAGLAALANDAETNLDPGRGLIVEFSNEVWNYGMPQWGQFSTKLGSGFSWEGIADLDAHSTSVFKGHVTSGRSCKIVIARQEEYDGTLTVAQQRYQLAGVSYDMIAMAPYFFTTADKGANAVLFATDPTTAVTNIINGMVGTGVSDSAPTMMKNLVDVARWKGFADAAGVPLAFYEWGQGEGNYDDSIQPLMVAVNRDERMKTLIYDPFAAGMPDGIGPLCHYNDCGLWTKYGNWGAIEYTAQAAQATPPAKYRALVAAASGAAIPADFSLAVSGSASLAQGSATTRTVTLTPLGGFAGTVPLSVSAGLPAGVTAAFSPTSVVGGGAVVSTLTLTASGSASVGLATLTIRGFDSVDSIAHTATTSLNVTAPPPSPPPATYIHPRRSSRLSPGGMPVPIAVIEWGYPTPSLATLYAVILTPGGVQAWNGTALEAANSAHWGTYALALADSAGIGVYRAAIPAALPAGAYSIYVHLKAGGSPAPTDSRLAADAGAYWDGRGLVTPATVTSVDGVMRAGSSGGNLPLDAADTYANALPVGAVNQYLQVVGGTGAGQVIPVASISGSSGARVAVVASGYALLTPLATDSQYYWTGAATQVSASDPLAATGVIRAGETGYTSLKKILAEALGAWDTTSVPGYVIYKLGGTEVFRSPVPTSTARAEGT